MIKVKKISKTERVKNNAIEINIVFFFGGRLSYFFTSDIVRRRGFASGETLERGSHTRAPDFRHYSCRKRKFDENK